MKVKKRSGRKESFSFEKLRNSILRAGGSAEDADFIEGEVKKKFTDSGHEVKSSVIRDFVIKRLIERNGALGKEYLSSKKTVEKMGLKHAGSMEEKLAAICSNTASLACAYGGFEITVKTKEFDYGAVIDFLLSKKFSVTIAKRGPKTILLAKPMV